MAIIFFGTPRFAVPSLKALVDGSEDIALVVTQPDKVKGRGHVLSPPPVKETAQSRGIAVMQPRLIKDSGFHDELRSLNPEFIVVVAYGRILPEEVLAIPEKGCINVHASLLPKYRGAAPVQWALINGGKTTGVTTMLMDEGMDTGDVLMSAELAIGDNDNAGTLSEKLSVLGAKVLMETVRGMREGKVRPAPQEGEPTYAPPLKKGDGRMDWNKSAVELSDFIRGMHPWPSAFCYLNGEMIKIVKAMPLDGSGAPGRIEKASGGVLIAGTGRGLLLIEELQPQGKRVMPAKAFLAGRRLREGDEAFS